MPTRTGSSIKTEIFVKTPKMFIVTMHNDDYTTMEFVVDILVRIFNKSMIEATAIMMEIHEKGKSLVGLYTYDIAVTKKMQSIQLANEKNFPLKITIEEEL